MIRCRRFRVGVHGQVVLNDARRYPLILSDGDVEVMTTDVIDLLPLRGCRSADLASDVNVVGDAALRVIVFATTKCLHLMKLGAPLM